MWATITKPFAWLFVWLYNLTGSYGAALLLFALAVNLVMTPFMAKSKKGMMRQTRLQPRIQELQRRHEGNQQKLNEEMQKLYREEGVNPLGGCLWSLIPFPILIALYSVIRQPLTRMMFVSDEVLEAIRQFCIENAWYVAPASNRADAYVEIKLADAVHHHFSEVNAHLQNLGLATDRLIDLNFNLFGVNLGDIPWDEIKAVFTGAAGAAFSAAALGLVLIPLISAILSWLSMKVSNLANPQTGVETQQQAQMKSMNLLMPIMSLWFCFIMPAAMGVYWSCNSVFGMARDFILTKIYKRKLDLEDAERNAARNAREREMEQRRIETERLRAEGKSEQNTNTSKKKIQQNEKQRQAERSAAIAKEERAARREQLGIKEAEKPASQVGNRRYARGRAYVPDRFSNPENAEEATLAAAAESEGNLSIDESVAEESLFPSTVEETAAEESAVNEQE